MITGVHALLYSRDVEATRAFFRDALRLASVDAGDGWLIFALPPAELGIHPAEDETGAEIYLLCDDVEGTARQLVTAGAELRDGPSDRSWGRLVTLRIPGAISIGIYEPRHPTAISS